MTEYQPARERDTRVPDRGHRNHCRRQVPLGVARPAPVDTPSISLGPERRVVPVLRASLRHHVRVRLEEQSLPRPVALPHRPHVRTARRNVFDPYPEAAPLQIIGDEPRNMRLVAISHFGTVDARDADEVPRQANEFLAVDLSTSTSSRARWNLMFTSVSTSGSVNLNPPAAAHHQCSLMPSPRHKLRRCSARERGSLPRAVLRGGVLWPPACFVRPLHESLRSIRSPASPESKPKSPSRWVRCTTRYLIAGRRVCVSTLRRNVSGIVHPCKAGSASATSSL